MWSGWRVGILSKRKWRGRSDGSPMDDDLGTRRVVTHDWNEVRWRNLDRLLHLILCKHFEASQECDGFSLHT